jgi:integrase
MTGTIGKGWEIVKRRMKDNPDRIFSYNADSVSANFTRTVKRLHIDDLHFHDLRHYAITALFRKGLTIPLVSIVSGHKNWQNLKRYTELSSDDVHKAFEGRS